MDNSLIISIFAVLLQTDKTMKKLDSTNAEETLNQEVKRLRKENSKLKSQKEASDAQVKALKKELKKKDVPQVTLTKEQLELLSKVFPDINSLFN